MKKYLMLLLALSATQASAQEASIATLTVAEWQKMYESDDQKERFQQSIQGYFNGYEIGFYDGVMSALVAAGAINERPAIDFTDCMPDSRRLFHEMMSVTDARADLTVPSFVMQAVLSRCSSRVAALAGRPQNR